jgi:hypothetical protein
MFSNGNAWDTDMKIFLTLLLFFPLPALAEDMTVSIGAVSETWTLSAADQTKFEQWVQNAYKCTIVPPATTCTALTVAESEALWATATLQGTIDNVNRYHNILAAQEAVAGTPPITPQIGKTKK